MLKVGIGTNSNFNNMKSACCDKTEIRVVYVPQVGLTFEVHVNKTSPLDDKCPKKL